MFTTNKHSIKYRGHEVITTMPGNKYKNKKTVFNGVTYDSKKEANRAAQLRILEKVGQIKDLKRQERFNLVVNGVNIGFYKADFSYINKRGTRIVEDVKSAYTRKLATYRIKKKLVKALFGIDILET